MIFLEPRLSKTEQHSKASTRGRSADKAFNNVLDVWTNFQTNFFLQLVWWLENKSSKINKKKTFKRSNEHGFGRNGG